ncbi:LOW QUALITY PROTEIN: receptor protein kinase-like protein At4g34220 [Hevea brasiliensis]|uniref:LOW QUALITY PROTEIN: receptor protein kinase-like protein At4g34220 n=1 Tax=Hevea brasiliensis TaxID=3981 RepID=UPI0025E0AD6F|nr:LOW QUALITY PROTEIN: receptor protein kinase-like protein At4g34220 [Hevea brasiliensis]
MSLDGINLRCFTFVLGIVLVLVFVLVPAFALNTDGVLLLSFKYSVLSDPLSVLESWNYDDVTPCSWKGVTCTELGLPGTPDMFRVTSLVLPRSQLLGSIPPDLGFIQHLRHLDLSSNFLNGSLPSSFFNSTELEVISLSGNEISGDLPESIGGMRSLQCLNLSDNALAGKVPKNLTTLQNLTVLSLRTNHFSGYVPSGFNSVEVLDLSSNLLNGSLPLDFGGDNLRYLNLSCNNLSGPISQAFAKKIPQNATIDLSFNNLTGAIPESVSLLNQKTESFRGNVDLCGKPLKNLCSIPSTRTPPPNISTISPAIAVIPKPLESNPVASSSGTQNTTTQNQPKNGLKTTTIAAIAVADLAGISILAMAILYVYQLKKKKTLNQKHNNNNRPPKSEQKLPSETIISKVDQTPVEPRKPTTWSCLTIKAEETSEEATTSDSDHDGGEGGGQQNEVINVNQNQHQQKGGKLVIVDGETELDMETLLKASAYILGSSKASIVYKAVLADGTAFAVRRIGESGVESFRDFENQVRFTAKFRHPNLVKVRGFYWGDNEKLVIYDYISNGSLASSSYRKSGSSSFHMPLEVRFNIARGVARGLAFIHDKKYVHGSIRPTNILLNSDTEPIIADFGLNRLISSNNNSCKASNSGWHFGNQRSNSTSQDHFITASPYATPSFSITTCTSPYQAPESLKNLKSNPKWDVYSFGIILLELLIGRVLSNRELSQWTTGSMTEDKNQVLKLADVAIMADVVAKEDAMVACLKLGFSCACFAPEKRPSMKEALQVLEKIT